MIKEFITKIMAFLGFKIIRIGREKERLFDEFTQDGALYRSSLRNLKIGTVIDIGASDGRWSRMCMKYFPDSSYLLIEAQKEHEENLKKFCSELNNANYIIAAAGDTDDKIYFDNSTLFGGVASHTPLKGRCSVIDSRKIDTLVNELKLTSPFLLKLDTHGFEIPILEGALNTLKESSLLIIEAYNFVVAENGYRFFELCKYLENKGFLPIDLVDLTHRKKDNSLWQMDIYFLPAEREEFKNNSYNL